MFECGSDGDEPELVLPLNSDNSMMSELQKVLSFK